MDVELAANYTSASQKARVITENWLATYGYCPTCGDGLKAARANSKVFDFQCIKCNEQFELKGKRSARTSSKINDGAYSSMMERIMEPESPHFFFLGYDARFSVTNLLAVPNYFFQPSVIEERKPLAVTARRAGWIGCNILLDQIPEIGKIKLVQNSEIIDQEEVIKTWQKTAFLSQQKQVETRGWTLDVMKCIERLHSDAFNLEAIYKFEPELSKIYPNNRFIKDKIRQQLQVLRDAGYIKFVSRGNYSLVT